jgi:hypothetical protein
MNSHLQKINILKPHEFLPEHEKMIRDYKLAIKILSTHFNDLIIGIKDVDSKYLVTNNGHMKALGLKNESDIIGYDDSELANPTTLPYVSDYKLEDITVVKNLQKMSILKVHDYADGLKTRIIHKIPFYHKESNSVIGIGFFGCVINLSNLLHLIPNYANVINKVKIQQHKSSSEKFLINDISFTEYEYEICYLLSVKWSFGEIAHFMNIRSIDKKDRTADTIKKTKDNICRKFGILGHLSNLTKILNDFNIHLNPPQSILSAFYGCIEI